MGVRKKQNDEQRVCSGADVDYIDGSPPTYKGHRRASCVLNAESGFTSSPSVLWLPLKCEYTRQPGG